MGFFDYFRRSQKASASIAKDRLSIIVARERNATRDAPDYLPQLQQELLQVIAKYEHIDIGQVSVNIDRESGCDVLELNIVLSDAKQAKAQPVLEKQAAAAS